MSIWTLHEKEIPVKSGTNYKDGKGRLRLNKMFKEMPVNNTFQVQILAASVWEPPKKLSETSPGYGVRAAHRITLPGKRVTKCDSRHVVHGTLRSLARHYSGNRKPRIVMVPLREDVKNERYR